jgi:hypothetical protein
VEEEVPLARLGWTSLDRVHGEVLEKLAQCEIIGLVEVDVLQLRLHAWLVGALTTERVEVNDALIVLGSKLTGMSLDVPLPQSELDLVVVLYLCQCGLAGNLFWSTQDAVGIASLGWWGRGGYQAHGR